MTILCIETSTIVCSAALVVDGEPVASRIDMTGGNHARLLPLFIEELLHDSLRHHLSIDAIALSDGPGSYTGLRIGAASAKGLCYGLSCPLVPIHSTEVLCASYLVMEQQTPSSAVLCPMIDARRMEVYTACYDTAIHEIVPISAQIIGSSTLPLSGSSSHPHFFFGDGATKCASFLESDYMHFTPGIVPDAAAMGHLAEERLATHQIIEGVKLAYYEPFYLKQFVAAQSHVKGLR